MKFEDLKVWQDTRVLVSAVYQVCGQGELAKDFGLRSQIQRAAVSTMTNIAEGFERSSNGEKKHFYTIARASCGETRSLLYVLLDSGFIDKPNFEQLYNQCVEVGKQITGLITSIQSRR